MEIKKSIKHKSEFIAKRQLLDEIFNDLYSNRTRIYRINFFRGVCFGFGSILGGTVIVAIIVWILSQIASWFPVISDITNGVVNTLR